MRTSGLFDLQVNGFAGVDFNDPAITPKALDHALEAMLTTGVTGCLPTLITAHEAELGDRFLALDTAVHGSRLGPVMVPGYHLEGPFLNDAPGYRGCHPPGAMIDPDVALVARLDAVIRKPILLVTLAPERSGGQRAVADLVHAGKTVAIGHSAAGHDEVRMAADAGATLSTHLGNGLPPHLPKLENTVLAQLAEPRLHACLIADGHHMSPAALSALIRLKGAGSCILVTDAVLAAAAAPGPYRFAGMDVVLDETGKVAQPGSGVLAGSALRLDQAVRNAVDWNIADADLAIRMAGDHALKALGFALKHSGISFDRGQVEWNTALEPHVIRPSAA